LDPCVAALDGALVDVDADVDVDGVAVVVEGEAADVDAASGGELGAELVDVLVGEVRDSSGAPPVEYAADAGFGVGWAGAPASVTASDAGPATGAVGATV
jgi:hypothetical protein